MARSLWIIADDYGLGELHDAVIRKLLQASAIHATSVLSETCTLASAAALSQLWTSDRRVGLHFNLTWPADPDECRPSRTALLASSLFGVGGAAAARQLHSQWLRFHHLFGRAPDYIDGHEHCHAFPSVRPIVLEFASTHDVSVRSMVPMRPPQSVKTKVIATLGRTVHREACKLGIRTNETFGGVLPINRPERAIHALVSEIDAGREIAADNSKEGETWIMTHPGDANDPIQIPGHPPSLRAMEARLLERMCRQGEGSAYSEG